MTLCVKVDWVAKGGGFMRRKYVGIDDDAEAVWVTARVVEELKALPQFGELLLLQVHDDLYESGKPYDVRLEGL
ncbi:hypothetical protein LCGC14_2024710 [marine sediment metagenome]|uniref:Uncharacterized protein n=1 Tax=marine sediment metagenome TaxID=412755 RepID=A0A0F9FJ05_9ZZZZ